MEPGFVKAQTDNLPKIDMMMLASFFGNNPDFVSAEIRGQKLTRSARESYGDKAIGYVQVRREGDMCIVKARITPEHSVRKTAYRVSASIDEKEEVIQFAKCDDCAASQGWLFLIYILQLFCIRIPLHFFHFFLGFYTKRQVIRFWQCIPLLKGLGYMLLIVKIITLILNQYYTTKLIYTWILFSSHAVDLNTNGWKSCNYDGATNACLPIVQNVTTNCKNGTQYELSIFHFFKVFIHRHELPSKFISKPKLPFVLINLGLWVAFFIPLFMGITRFMIYFMTLLYAVMIPLVMVYLYIITKIKVEKISFEHYWTTTALGNFDDKVLWWALSTVHVADPLDLPNSIWLGTLMPPSFKIGVSVISINVLATFVLFVFIWSSKLALSVFVDRHKNLFAKCFILISDYDILSITMEALLQTYQPYLCICVYLLARIIYSILDNILAGLVIYNSLVDAIPLMKHNRFLTCTAFCILNHLMSFIFFTSLYNIIFSTWKYSTVILELFIFLIVGISLNYIYSGDMLTTDYIFTYLEKPPNLIMWAWYAAPVIAMILFCIAAYGVIQNMIPDTNLRHLFMIVAILLPMLLYFFVEAAKGVNTYEFDPDSPAENWGPKDPVTMNNRNKFVPYRNLNYRHNCVTCNHVCLVKVKEYTYEEYDQDSKMEQAVCLLDEHARMSKTRKH